MVGGGKVESNGEHLFHVGLEEIVKGKWRVCYRDTLLGYLDEWELRIQDQLGRPLKAAR